MMMTGEDENKKSSSAEIIVQLALKNITLFKERILGFLMRYQKQTIFMKYCLQMEANLSIYLSKLYYDKCDKKIANAESINNAKRTLGVLKHV